MEEQAAHLLFLLAYQADECDLKLNFQTVPNVILKFKFRAQSYTSGKCSAIGTAMHIIGDLLMCSMNVTIQE